MAGKDLQPIQSQEEKRQKRMKLAAYVGVFAMFQVIIVLVFSLVIMKLKTPKFRIETLRIQSLNVGTQAVPSFGMSFIAPIRIKNTNFGPYKYDATTVNFTYGGVQIGQATIPKSKTNFKSTKKVDVSVVLNSDSLPANSSILGTEVVSGVLSLLTLSSQGKMNGTVELMLIFKKKKSTEMNCTMAIDVSSKTVKSLTCQ